MSTTWVFLGLLAGREIGMSLTGKGINLGMPLGKVLKMVFKDLSYALFGLFVSILLAISINEDVRREIFSLFGF
jgi:hypothetical protein